MDKDMSKHDFSIRPYEPRDAAGLAVMRERSIRQLGLQAYSALQVETWARRAQDVAGLAARLSDGRRVWVAIDGTGVPVGLIDLEADGHIDFLYVDPNAAGQGVAASLYEAVEVAAQATGLSCLHSEVSEIAKGFFERQGFEALHRRDLEMDGVAIHNWKMEKSLSAE